MLAARAAVAAGGEPRARCWSRARGRAGLRAPRAGDPERVNPARARVLVQSAACWCGAWCELGCALRASAACATVPSRRVSCSLPEQPFRPRRVSCSLRFRSRRRACSLLEPLFRLRRGSCSLLEMLFRWRRGWCSLLSAAREVAWRCALRAREIPSVNPARARVLVQSAACWCGAGASGGYALRASAACATVPSRRLSCSLLETLFRSRRESCSLLETLFRWRRASCSLLFRLWRLSCSLLESRERSHWVARFARGRPRARESGAGASVGAARGVTVRRLVRGGRASRERGNALGLLHDLGGHHRNPERPRRLRRDPSWGKGGRTRARGSFPRG
jgi:hypothetical protein